MNFQLSSNKFFKWRARGGDNKRLTCSREQQNVRQKPDDRPQSPLIDDAETLVPTFLTSPRGVFLDNLTYGDIFIKSLLQKAEIAQFVEAFYLLPGSDYDVAQ